MANDKTKKEIEIVINGMKANASLGEMEKALKVLNQQFKELPKNTKEWKDKMQEVANMKGKVTDIKKDLGGVSDSMRNLKDSTVSFGKAFIAAFAAGAVIGALKEWYQANKEFEKSLSSLRSLTGATKEDLKFYAAAAIEMGKSTGIGANDVVEAIKKIGGAKPELLASKEALVDFTRETIALSQAAEMDLGQAATSLTDAMNQFAAPAQEAGRYINVLAAGAQAGAAEVPELTDALLKFGVAAKSSNVNIEESVALIETLAEKGLKGAEAGTALRNVMAKLAAPDTLPKEALAALRSAGVDIENLSNKALPFSKRLDELAKIQGNASAITRVFGLENKIAAEALIENRGRVEELTKAVTGTTSAYEQAAINTDNLAGASDRFGSSWNALLVTMSGSTGVFKSVIDWGAKMLNTITDGLKSVDQVRAEVQMKALAQDMKEDLEEIGVITNSLVKQGVEAEEAKQRAASLFIQGLQETLTNNSKLTEAESKALQSRIDNATKFEETRLASIKSSNQKIVEENTNKNKSVASGDDKAHKEAEKREKEALAEKEKIRQAGIEAIGKKTEELREASFKAEEEAEKDEFKKREMRIRNQATLELEQFKGTELQKGEFAKLIDAQVADELAGVQRDRWAKEAEDAKEAERLKLQGIAEMKLADAEAQLEAAGETYTLEDDLEMMQERMDAERELKLLDKDLTESEIRDIEADYQQQKDEIDKEFAEKKKQRAFDTANQGLQAASQLVGAINNLQNAQTAREIDNAEKAKNAKIAKLDEQLAAGKISQDAYDAEKQKAEEEYEKKSAQLKRDQQKKNKKAAIIQALINTALGISAALSSGMPQGIVFAALAAVLGGLQVAAIAKQPDSSFALGGFTVPQKAKKPFGNYKDVINHFAVGGFTGGSQASFKYGGWVRSRRIGEIGEAGTEYVIPNWQVSDPVGANIVGYLEAARQRKRFAEGGFTDASSVPAVSTSGNQPAAVDQSIAYLQSIDAKLDVLNATFSAYPEKIQVYNPITEIQDGLEELAMIRAQNTIS